MPNLKRSIYLLAFSFCLQTCWADATITDVENQVSQKTATIHWKIHSNDENAVTSNIKLDGYPETECIEKKECVATFNNIAPQKTLNIHIQAHDQVDNYNDEWFSSITTLPILNINALQISAEPREASFYWDIQSSDPDSSHKNIQSSCQLDESTSAACVGRSQCEASFRNLQPEHKYHYKCEVANNEMSIKQVKQGYFKTPLFPSLHPVFEETNERCDCNRCTIILKYTVSEGQPPYTASFISSSPEIIEQRKRNNQRWSIEMLPSQTSTLHFKVTDILHASGESDLTITSEGSPCHKPKKMI